MGIWLGQFKRLIFDMIDTVVKIECDWCGTWQEVSKHLHKGIGEKRFRKRMQKDGWLTVVGGDMVRDFCGQECYELYKKDESKP